MGRAPDAALCREARCRDRDRSPAEAAAGGGKDRGGADTSWPLGPRAGACCGGAGRLAGARCEKLPGSLPEGVARPAGL